MDIATNHWIVGMALACGVGPIVSDSPRPQDWLKFVLAVVLGYGALMEFGMASGFTVSWHGAVLIVLVLAVYNWIALSRHREILKSLAQANEDLLQLALQDHLTHIANRRHFDYQLGIEISRAQRVGKPFAVLLIDVDYFKSYNDYGGHLLGDACLVRIAETLCKAVKRPEDMVARYGGEEFVILVPGADLESAIEIADHLRLAVAQMGVTNPDPRRPGAITVSVGVTAAHPTHEPVSSTDVLAAADKALYQAKGAGRNCVRAIQCRAIVKEVADAH